MLAQLLCTLATTVNEPKVKQLAIMTVYSPSSEADMDYHQKLIWNLEEAISTGAVSNFEQAINTMISPLPKIAAPNSIQKSSLFVNQYVTLPTASFRNALQDKEILAMMIT